MQHSPALEDVNTSASLPVIVMAGEVGVGKSCLINIALGKKLLRESGGRVGVTTKEAQKVTLEGRTIIDTVPFPNRARVPQAGRDLVSMFSEARNYHLIFVLHWSDATTATVTHESVAEVMRCISKPDEKCSVIINTVPADICSDENLIRAEKDKLLSLLKMPTLDREDVFCYPYSAELLRSDDRSNMTHGLLDFMTRPTSLSMTGDEQLSSPMDMLAPLTVPGGEILRAATDLSAEANAHTCHGIVRLVKKHALISSVVVISAAALAVRVALTSAGTSNHSLLSILLPFIPEDAL